MKIFPSGLLFFAGFVAMPATVAPSEPFRSIAEYRNDPRLKFLERFFQRFNCPVEHLSIEFLRAADIHNLDWRLLPSISLVESGGGREARNNNLFGWDNGRAVFPDWVAGIHTVASRLANSKLYRDKKLDQVLWTYNPNTGYGALVKSVMRRISPSANP